MLSSLYPGVLGPSYCLLCVSYISTDLPFFPSGCLFGFHINLEEVLGHIYDFCIRVTVKVKQLCPHQLLLAGSAVVSDGYQRKNQ